MFRTFSILLVCLLCTSCASHYGAARIVSHPAGAEVVDADSGKVLGVTPTLTWWKDSSNKRQHVLLHFKKDGYYQKPVSYWLSMRHSSLEAAKKEPQLFETSLDKQGN